MPTMADLLSDEQARLLNEIQFPSTPVAQPGAKRKKKQQREFVTEAKHPRICGCERRPDGFVRDGGRLLHKACGRPLPEASVLHGVSAVPVAVPCAGGCGSNVTIATRKKDVAGLAPRAAVCRECAIAISTGSPMTVLARPKSAAPIGVVKSKATKATKETPVKIDLDAVPDAELGRMVKEAERERLAEAMPAKVKKAKKKRDQRERTQVKAKKAERSDLSAIGVLAGFTLQGVEVPALDVSALANLDEMPPPKARSPYNKVRYRMGEALLSTQDEPGIGLERTTWATLVTEHQRLSAEVATEPAKAEAKPAKQPKAQVSAVIDLDEKAKVKALRDVLGCSKAEARAILASV